MLKSKLHQARVTEACLYYEGSITIDRDLMDAVRILPYEKVLVSNLANGNRFETYAIAGKAGSGVICLNGPTAHLGQVGDTVIILAFAVMPSEQARYHKPLVLVLDQHNKPAGPLKEV